MIREGVPRSSDSGGGHAERGAATVEMVLLTPLFLAVLAFLVLAGRLSTVSADVAAASRDAARAASLASTYSAAVDAAEETATGSLARQDVTCRNLTVELGDPSTFVAGGEVEVRVACEVLLGDVALPGLPGSRIVGRTSTEVIDRWRSVGPAG
ncbi:MAG TPA: TadE family protein [Iamia sp.]|nr:TadE family protein [Iamia sp.]